MQHYQSQLRQALEHAEAERLAQKVEAQAHVRERLKPIEDRLSRLLTSIPAPVQAEGLSLASLQASLRGRWRGHAHPGEVGRALRKLGFERRRNWRDSARGYPALWFPGTRRVA